jgi:hypothetical protein
MGAGNRFGARWRRRIMTEEEWLACQDVRSLLAYHLERMSKRKMRWFAIACCRQLEQTRKIEELRKALAAAERYADGRITDGTASNWRRRTWVVLRANRRHAAKRNTCRVVAQAFIVVRFSSTYHWTAIELAAKRAKKRTGPEWEAAIEFARQELALLLRDIVGDPFAKLPKVDPAWLSWNNATVARLAQQIYDQRALDRLPVLADALEEAGCSDTTLLTHFRHPGPHVPGCWPLDLLLGLE